MNRFNRRLRFFCLLMIGVLTCTASVWGQVSTSSITGTVLDKTGAVVPGAKVTATNEGTNVSFTATTTETGAYTFPSLVAGPYTIAIEAQGFRKWVSTKNMLTVGSPLVVSATLEVGPVSSVVQVESTYQRLETVSPAISDVMTQEQVKNLPLNGRNPLSLLTLEPGVVQRTYGGAGSGTHVFGSRDRAHNITIDGIDANESTVPNPQSNLQRLNPDNVQEFRTVTLGATAETGRNSGANVMVATRSGTNSFHGSVFYFNRNTALTSNEFFNNAAGKPRPDLKLNQWGVDVGGPIWKNKTFYFGSYQGNIIKQTAPITSFYGTPMVYTSTLRNGIFRFVRGTVTTPSGKNFSNNDRQLVDPSGALFSTIPLCTGVLGGTATTNCVDGYNIFAPANIPAGSGISAADPAVAGLLTRIPQANSFNSVGDGLNTAGYAWNPPTKFTGPHVMVRVDHNFGPNDNIFVRWLQNRYDTKEGDFLNSRPMVYPGFPPLGEVSRMGRNLAVSYRHVFTPALVNEATVGFNRFVFSFTFGESNPGFGDPTKDPPWADSCIYGSFVLMDPAYCVSPHTARAVTTPQIIDNVSWIHGAHTIRAGINFRFYIHNDSRGFFGGTVAAPGVLFNAGSGTIYSSSAGTVGTSQGSWTNVPSTSSVNSTDIGNLQQAIVELAGIPYSLRQSYVADYAGDKYVSAKYATVYSRAHQYDSYIQDEWKLRPNLTLNLGVRWEFNPSPFDKRQSLVPDRPLDGSQGAVTFVKSKHWFSNDNIKSLAPRIGIAWSPDSKTSVRSGYALLFDTISTFQVTAIAGKMPGFMLGCRVDTDGTGTVTASPTGCATVSGTTNRISTGFPLSIPAPSSIPSAQLSPPVTSSSQAPSIGAFDQNMKNPAVHQWSLSIQHELPLRFVGEIGYIGKRGTHLQRAYDLNQIDPSAQFLSDFLIARSNYLKGCRGDGTKCPTGVTGQTPTLLTSMVKPCPATGTCSNFWTSSSTATDLRQGGVGNFAARMDALSMSSSQRNSSYILRPNGQFSQIFYQDSGGDSYYHGLYISLRRRFEKGLDFGFSYTFSKSIDDMSVDPTGASTGGGLSTTSFQRTPTDVRNFRLDRARSDFDNRHVALTNLLYEFPFGKGRRWASGVPNWLNQIIGGWTLTGIYVYQSGEPYTLSAGVRTTNGSHVSSGIIVGPPIGNGILQPAQNITGPVLFRTGGPITSPLTDPHLNCQNIIGTSSFVCVPPPGQNGVGRNTMQGTNYWNIDAGLLKIFDVTERIKIQFRAEVFNVLNHPNFENPRNATSGSATVTSGAFGQTCCATAAVTSAQQVNPIGEPMRIIQLGLKINF